MQREITAINKTVEEMVNELIGQGYNKIEAIKVVHESYEIDNRLDSLSIFIHVSSLVLILSLLFNYSIIFIPLKIIFGIFYSIFFVGYSVLRVFYPNELKQLSNLHILGISLGVSFAITSVIGLLLNFTMGITLDSSIISAVIITEIFNLIYNLRGSK
jgi:uncharacterized membrane protein